jgi:hypothetical protein
MSKEAILMTNEKITLDVLDKNSVSVKKQRYIMQDGIEYPVGQPWRRAYANSTEGRAQIQAELPEPYLSAVMAVWGDDPIVEENQE